MFLFFDRIFKEILLVTAGGIIYYLLEVMYRGYSHWTMFLLGGVCFVACGLIKKLICRNSGHVTFGNLCRAAVTCGVVITTLEFITGCICNIWLGLGIWNYTSYDILGQVCVPYFFLWCLLSVPAMLLYDSLLRFLNKDLQKV